MKKLLLIALSFFLLGELAAQEIVGSARYSHSNYFRMKNNVGYMIGYNIILKSNHKIGFVLAHDFNNTDYSYTFSSDADGLSYFRNVSSKNRKVEITFNYAWNLLNKNKSRLYFGPKIGLNYFKISESGEARLTSESEFYEYSRSYWDNTFGVLGLLIEYDRKLFSDFTYVFVSASPELIFYPFIGFKGYSGPGILSAINLNLGLKLNINKN